jgi:glycosyltransferase involved in cell wall biosynthesis
VPRAKITIIPEAAAARFTPVAAPNDAAVRARLHLPERYLLHPGGSDARKRVPELIDVFAALAKDDPDLALVLVGPVASGDGHPAVRRALDATSARHRVLLAGVLPGPICAVCRGAAALVLATRHEGFGLPVVEALRAACGGGDGRRRGARGRRRPAGASRRGRRCATACAACSTSPTSASLRAWAVRRSSAGASPPRDLAVYEEVGGVRRGT